MRGLLWLALMSVAVVVMLAQAVAQSSQKWAWCVNQGSAFSPDQRINGCSSIIQPGRETRRNLALLQPRPRLLRQGRRRPRHRRLQRGDPA
jgi:hypothetical protein